MMSKREDDLDDIMSSFRSFGSDVSENDLYDFMSSYQSSCQLTSWHFSWEPDSWHSFDDPEPIAAINQPVRQEEGLQKRESSKEYKKAYKGIRL